MAKSKWPSRTLTTKRINTSTNKHIYHLYKMDEKLRLKLLLEVIWWAFTVFLIWIVLRPIQKNIHEFPFYLWNIIFIVASVTLTRLAFLLPYTFLAKTLWLKVAIILITPLMSYYLWGGMSLVRNLIDEEGLQSIMRHLIDKDQDRLSRYIRNELLFFGVASVGASIAFAIRMLISIFRTKNRGTV